ncbi:MAG TPA: ABC transporter permease subunit [Acidobacteriota bacterium]|jgi:phosphate transport system permease protein|nr:ABC transporter permease subunit [Acidobacteriota bacterium]HQQ46234.1 ABC transporter permease subunit [Acidobacteriota bacterium]
MKKLEETFFVLLMAASFAALAVGLFSITVTVFMKGLPSLSWQVLTQTPKGGYVMGKEGGILNAILGSVIIGLAATVLSLVYSLPIVFYINIYRFSKSKFSRSVRFFLDLLWGIPSIVYGAFGFAIMIMFKLPASMLAGIITLSFLVLPIMARTMDETLRMIPFEMKQAAYSLGATRFEISTKIILKQALPGLLTATLLAFGRGIGDAASVLMTASYTDSLPSSPFAPVATLPLAVFFQLSTPFREIQERGYAAAFVLTIMMLLVSLAARWMSKGLSKYVVR